MKELKNFLICLDGTSLDDQIIAYCSMIGEIVNCNNATFIHAGSENPSKKAELERKVKTYFQCNVPNEIRLVHGESAAAILSWSGIKEIDLIIMGIKPKAISSGKHAAKIINGSLCSVLLVPTSAAVKLDKILVPIDFSKNSLNAYKLAKTMERNNSSKVLLQHVYRVPIGFYSTGKSYDEFAAIMKKNAEKDFTDFLRKNKLQAEVNNIILSLDEDDLPSDKIYAAAQYEKCDLIMLGSVGKSKAASLILRSTSIDLLKYDENTPVMVVKDKKDSVKFFDALLRI